MNDTPELVDLMLADGVQLRRGGSNAYYGRCPFHADRSPSFQVTLAPWGQWTFKCWSTACGERGGLKRYRELTNRPTADDIPEPREQRPREQYERPTRELMTLAAQHYNELLLQYPEATAYLANRGVDPEDAHRWGIGYAPGSTLFRLLQTLMTEEELSRCALLKPHRREDRLTRRIIFPAYDRDGMARWYTGRAIDPDAGRNYLSLPGRRPALLTLLTERDARKSDPLVITEGPMDLLSTLAAGLRGAATAGNPHAARVSGAINALADGDVWVVPDQDPAGAEWGRIITAAATRRGRRVLTINLPEQLDDPAESMTVPRIRPASIYATAIRSAIWTDYNLQRHQDAGQSHTPTGAAPKEELSMAHMKGAGIRFFGNLTEDPRTLNKDEDRPMVGFRVANNYRAYSREEDSWVDQATFYGCTAFGAMARMARDLEKGDLVYIEGHLQTQEVEGRDGVVRTYHNVEVSDMHNRLAWSSKGDDNRRGNRGNGGGDRDSGGGNRGNGGGDRDSGGSGNRGSGGGDRDSGSSGNRSNRGGNRGSSDARRSRPRDNRQNDNQDDRGGRADRAQSPPVDDVNIDDLPF